MPALILFPIWALLLSLVAVSFPAYFVGLKSWIVPLLMLVMLGMGLTLSWRDFKAVWQRRQIVGIGVAIQYSVMPLAAWLIGLGLGLSDELLIGMILVGATAGGTASNVMAYLAKGDLALSVSMTLLSTLLAVALLPFLSWLYLGQIVAVPAFSMLMMLLKIIVAPLAVGMLIKHFALGLTEKLNPLFPLISMAVILLIIAIVVALNANNLTTMAWSLALAVILHNLIGLAAGYWAAIKLGYDNRIARTVAIEVAMQNSGLSVALALKYFGAASALPGALFSIWHNISGSVFAAFWQGLSKKP